MPDTIKPEQSPVQSQQTMCWYYLVSKQHSKQNNRDNDLSKVSSRCIGIMETKLNRWCMLMTLDRSWFSRIIYYLVVSLSLKRLRNISTIGLFMNIYEPCILVLHKKPCKLEVLKWNKWLIIIIIIIIIIITIIIASGYAN